MDIVVTRCHSREIGKKHVAVEKYDTGDVRQHDGNVKQTAARWCRRKKNAHKRAAVGRGMADRFFFIWVRRILRRLVAVYIPFFYSFPFLTKIA
jgi:hypothetical protein